MATLITDPTLEQQLIAEREAAGSNHHDEVWEGIYFMAPLPNDEHQDLVGSLASILKIVIGWPGLGRAYPGVNVSDRETGWTKNYRVPDVAVFMNTGTARCCDTHWVGGPDFAVEVVSPGDRTQEKLEFYSQESTRELLIIDRDPWSLELLCLTNNWLKSVGHMELHRGRPVSSTVTGLTFALEQAGERTAVRVTHPATGQSWQI